MELQSLSSQAADGELTEILEFLQSEVESRERAEVVAQATSALCRTKLSLMDQECQPRHCCMQASLASASFVGQRSIQRNYALVILHLN